MHLVAVSPVDDEFCYQRPGEIFIDMGHSENIEGISGGRPLLGDSLGLSAVLHGRGVFCPLNPNVGDEF